MRLSAIAPLCVAWATSGCWLALGLEGKDYTLPDGGPNAGCGGVPPAMPVISRDAPAYASAESYPAEDANDGDYATAWRSGELPPVWLAYDLSRVDAAARTRIAAVYYNAGDYYDHAAAVDFQPAYSNVGGYVLQGSAAPGGALPEESTWVDLVTVEATTFNSRQHVLDFAGYDWIRLLVTASDGSDMNIDIEVNFDVHGAPAGACDDWILFGDQIVWSAITTSPRPGLELLPQRVAEADPSRYPLVQPGGMDRYLVSEARMRITGATGWLALFPGRYVGVGYGWQDALDGTSPESFGAITRDIVDAVLAAGKVPVVAKIAWSPDPMHDAAIVLLNEQLDQLLAETPGVLAGPDLHAALADDTGAFDGDYLSDAGVTKVQDAWVAAMRANVYGTP